MNVSGVGRKSAQSPQVLSTHVVFLPVHTANIRAVWVTGYPTATQGVIQSELNYSVVLQCLAPISPTPVLYWIFNGKPRGTGEKLIIRRLSREDLGTYMCVAKSSENQESSNSVAISLPGESPTHTPGPRTLASWWLTFLFPLKRDEAGQVAGP